jgi:hypothetical protein
LGESRSAQIAQPGTLSRSSPFSIGVRSPGALFLLKSSVARGTVLLLGIGFCFWADFVVVVVFFVRD